MLSRAPERTTRPTPDYRVHRVPNHRARVAGAVAVVAVIALVLGLRSPGSLVSQASSTVESLRPAKGGALGVDAGRVPDGTSVWDDQVPGVANLDADLLDALRRAAAAAGDDGVRFVVDSGWRSPEYQQHLLDDAVATYGSASEAARWVATPDTSAHVSGDAIDIGPDRATTWLRQHGAAYALCQIYDNEPWHYELRPDAVQQGCPATYADPTHDPRLHP
jgi:D-alanyl-D-alanine carboxypeptidase